MVTSVAQGRVPPLRWDPSSNNLVVSKGPRQSKLGACYELQDIIVAGGMIPPPRLNGRSRFVRTGRRE